MISFRKINNTVRHFAQDIQDVLQTVDQNYHTECDVFFIADEDAPDNDNDHLYVMVTGIRHSPMDIRVPLVDFRAKLIFGEGGLLIGNVTINTPDYDYIKKKIYGVIEKTLRTYNNDLDA